MTYIFKYTSDEQILRNVQCLCPEEQVLKNVLLVNSYQEFMEVNPDFPLPQGQWFEYSEEEFTLINAGGNHITSGGKKYYPLIQAINNLED